MKEYNCELYEGMTKPMRHAILSYQFIMIILQWNIAKKNYSDIYL